MKKYSEILNDIDKTYEELTRVKGEIDSIVSTWDGATFKQKIDLKKSSETVLGELGTKQKNLELGLKFLKNNAKIALFNEVMPVVLEAFGKYENKKYGPKTEEKIRNEIKERTNCSVYINNGINVTALNKKGYGTDYKFTCGTKYQEENRKHLLIDNKIQKLDFSDVELWYVKTDYIDDIPEAVRTIKELKAKAIEKQNELATICSEFNKLAVDGIENIYCDKRIYDRW